MSELDEITGRLEAVEGLDWSTRRKLLNARPPRLPRRMEAPMELKMTFATSDGQPATTGGLAYLPRTSQRYEIIRWPTGRTSVRAIRDDATPGPWAEYPPEADRV